MEFAKPVLFRSKSPPNEPPVIVPPEPPVVPTEPPVVPTEPPVVPTEGGGVIVIEDLEHRKSLILNSEIFIIKYGAEWCGPCKRIDPAYHKMADEDKEGRCVYSSEDVDEDFGEQPKTITSIPTFHIYKDKKFIDSISGTDLNSLLSIIDKLKIK